MLSAIKAILVLPLLFLVAASCSSPSKRTVIEFTLKDGSKIQCVEPPPDVFAKGLKVNADMAAEHIGGLLKGTGGVDVDVERIRQDVTSDVSWRAGYAAQTLLGQCGLVPVQMRPGFAASRR